MKRLACLLAAAAFWAAPASAAEVTADDFEAGSVGSVVKLCSAPESSAMNQYAQGFCYGWIAGIEQFYDALVADPRFNVRPTICTDGEISREEARVMLVDWAGRNPDSLAMPALSGLIQAIREKHPC